LGKFTLWPYNNTRGTFVKEVAVRKLLDRLFFQMCDYQGKPLQHIAVISLGDTPDFQPSSEQIIKEMRDVINALFLSAVVENNTVNNVSSENFQLAVQNFTPDSNRWAIEDGSFVRIKILGLRLKDLGVRLSPRASQYGCLEYNQELLDGCLRCQENSPETLYKQIFSSLQWASYSYENIPRFPYHSRILLLMIAFEILASHSKGLDRYQFAKWLDVTWGILPDDKHELQGKHKGPYGKVGMWGIEFYKYRNKIIHDGDPSVLPAHDSMGREYFETGVYVFSECVKDILRQEGCLPLRPENDNIVHAWRLMRK